MEKLTIKEQYEYFEETFDKFNTTLLDQTVSVGVWEKYNEETIELLEITDFSDNKYIFQKKYDESGLYELIFNQMEKIYIPKGKMCSYNFIKHICSIGTYFI